MNRRRLRATAREVGMILIALIFSLPFFLLISTALKPTKELFTTSPLAVPSAPDFGNFAVAWNAHGGGYPAALLSSVIITVVTVGILIVIGSLCAYVVARRPGRISGLISFLCVIAIIIPFQMSIIPLYSLLNSWGFIGTYLGMIVMWVGMGSPLTIFLYLGFIRSLPHDYEEAARLDGAGSWRLFWSIVFPLLRPVTGTVAILLGLFIWNDFFTALIIVGGSPAQTLPVMVYSFVGQYVTQWNYVFAAVILALIPAVAVFVVLQRRMIKGFAGGLRG
jgi:raffinose/stachyose/melibiose transport system permease protein